MFCLINVIIAACHSLRKIQIREQQKCKRVICFTVILGKEAEETSSEMTWMYIGAAAASMLILVVGTLGLVYYCKHKNKTRLQHIGPGKSAW